MASGSKKKNRNKKQQRKPHNHLPKVGTPADNKIACDQMDRGQRPWE